MRFRSSLRLGASAFLLSAFALPAACGESQGRECRVGADCASGMCEPDGRCAPAAPGSSSGTPAEADGGTSPDAKPSLDAAIDAKLPGCAANNDGLITREEVPIQAGLFAKYRVSGEEQVSTAGTPIANGRRAWDLSGALASDVTVLVETLPLNGKWYAPKFNGATYATKLRESSTLIGVFETGPAALTLRGVVSPDDGLTRTELTNDPPVTMLAFPLKLGAKWTSDVSVSGLAQGVPSTYTEEYSAEVDAAGELTTPLGKFEVLRVRLELTRTVGFLVTTTRTFAFVSECYGNVASITSLDNESDVEFTQALEIRRIAP